MPQLVRKQIETSQTRPPPPPPPPPPSRKSNRNKNHSCAPRKTTAPNQRKINSPYRLTKPMSLGFSRAASRLRTSSSDIRRSSRPTARSVARCRCMVSRLGTDWDLSLAAWPAEMGTMSGRGPMRRERSPQATRGTLALRVVTKTSDDVPCETDGRKLVRVVNWSSTFCCGKFTELVRVYKKVVELFEACL